MPRRLLRAATVRRRRYGRAPTTDTTGRSIVLPINPVPRYRALVAQLGVHGRDAATATAEAVRPGLPAGERLDALVRARDAFDHGIDDSSKLPLARHLFKEFYAGYHTADRAIDVLIASGAIPGARQRVGRQELLEGQRHFHSGVDLYRADAGNTVSKLRSVDFLDHSFGDAAAGLVMLRKPVLAWQLLRGIDSTRDAMRGGRELNDGTVRRVDELFGRAADGLQQKIDAAEQRAAGNDALLAAV